MILVFGDYDTKGVNHQIIEFQGNIKEFTNTVKKYLKSIFKEKSEEYIKYEEEIQQVVIDCKDKEFDLIYRKLYEITQNINYEAQDIEDFNSTNKEIDFLKIGQLKINYVKI